MNDAVTSKSVCGGDRIFITLIIRTGVLFLLDKRTFVCYTLFRSQTLGPLFGGLTDSHTFPRQPVIKSIGEGYATNDSRIRPVWGGDIAGSADRSAVLIRAGQ